MTQKVLIIGGNRGIGLEFVKKYKGLGYQVTATCRQTSKELGQLNVEVLENIDMQDDQSILSLSEKVQSIDLLIHNSGVMLPSSLDTLKENFDFSNIQKQFEINSLAPLKVIVALMDKINPKGKIALVTSQMGSIDDNTSGGSYGYRGSKAALNMFGKSLAHDLASKEIAVGLLHPGWVKTRMTGFGGLIDTEESVNGLHKIIEQLNLKNSGGFWHTNGKKILW